MQLHLQTTPCGDVGHTMLPNCNIFIRDTLVEKVTTFKYLGCIIAATGSDWPAVYHNLCKARTKWGMLSHHLIWEGATPEVSSRLYAAVVQAILLYDSESWTVTPKMLQTLDGFHHTCAHCICNQPPNQNSQHQWTVYPAAKALHRAHMKTICE
jgi:hypothetical protein